MSYNKLKSLVANVEAIETAMKIQVQGRQATAEEKEILSRYSGFGGIKEVLNIGTDKPIGGDMQEPIQRLQELINAYPHFTEPMRHNVIEGIKASVLTAFYTPKFLVDAVVRQIHATFSENGLKMRSFLEPSAGIGGFLPIAMSGTYDYAIEKDLISGMILSLLHENTLTRTAAFETIGEQGFEHTTFDVIASNIPFGNFRVFDAELWKKGGMYEQATKTIHNYFFVKAMELLNEGGLLAFITSRGIADTPGNKFVREYLVNHADLISAIRLYEMSVINETTKRTAETRDIMNLNLIAFYDNLFKPAKINIKAIMANLIGGIYYLILHRRCAKTCTIDFSTQEGEKVFFEWIDFLTDAIFDKLEAYERNRKAAQEMLSDGISEFKICKYMGINKNDLKMLLSNSHRNSRELSKES